VHRPRGVGSAGTSPGAELKGYSRMRLLTILNRVEKCNSFVYTDAHIEEHAGGPVLVVQVLRRKKKR
jgi:hypothetical protein